MPEIEGRRRVANEGRRAMRAPTADCGILRLKGIMVGAPLQAWKDWSDKTCKAIGA